MDHDRVAQFEAALRADGDRAMRERAVLDRGNDASACLVGDFEGIRIDERDWPLLVMEMPAGPVSDDAVRASLGHLERVMAQAPSGSRFFQVTDLSAMALFAPASQRRYAADWSRRNADLIARTRLGAVIVAPSPMLRAILSAVSWAKGSTTPAHFVSTRAEGVLQGIRALDGAQAPLAPHLVALRARLDACGA
jgi:hypothetical protein